MLRRNRHPYTATCPYCEESATWMNQDDGEAWLLRGHICYSEVTDPYEMGYLHGFKAMGTHIIHLYQEQQEAYDQGKEDGKADRRWVNENV